MFPQLPKELEQLIFEFDSTRRSFYLYPIKQNPLYLFELEFVTPYWQIIPECLNLSNPCSLESESRRGYDKLYSKQASNLIDFHHDTFSQRTTDLIKIFLFDTKGQGYWRVFKNIRDYTPMYKKLADDQETFIKEKMGYKNIGPINRVYTLGLKVN